ncbi:MAG: hypothetical protein GY898_09330 [Proteobacteria bacterium]|nr:hypothetical protein [Pseudomonadota bacterium]
MLGRALLLLIALLVLPAPALAGGVGVFDQTGFHFGGALREGGGTGSWMDQGGGIEIFLGKTDHRLSGRLRLSYAAIIDLSGGVQHAGLFSVGAQVELLDLEKKFGLYPLLDLGVSPLVTQIRFFVFADAGIGARYRINDVVSIFGELTGLVRYDKAFTGGPLIFLGARFAID